MFASIPFFLSLLWSKLQVPCPSPQLRELTRSKANASSNLSIISATPIQSAGLEYYYSGC